MFDLNDFISEYVIRRSGSMFQKDIDDNQKKLYEKIHGKSVLVIGGAGSIGSSFIKEMLPFEPGEVIIVDTNENALTELTRDLRCSGIYMPDTYRTYPMDYNSRPFRHMFMGHRNTGKSIAGFDIVCNFSAHKHVRSEKDIYSIEAMLRNNVINAMGLLDLLATYPPESFFCVSTDKAVNPVNVMGVSKRIMEDLIFSYSELFPVKTARFANVAFSNGSLLDGFMHRISKLQPISAPTDIKRYFVSPVESGQICLLAAIMGESRSIFFPELQVSQMESFDNIARNFLRVLGYEPVECKSNMEAVSRMAALKRGSREYPVLFEKSDTSGEKKFEEFYTSDELTEMKKYDAVGIIRPGNIPNRDDVTAFIKRLEDALNQDEKNKGDIIEMIHKYLPEFSHLETEKNLDEKM
ncbi:MAG: polysaccharide biosynthesis protein [Lachnospiraceae bacterium]|nr:polysaccharide biosynthesis protein [Lachnospiraceae bacterium]